MVKKMSKEQKESIDFYKAYMSAFKKKPSTFSVIMSFFLMLWVMVFSVTVFAVVTKLIVKAWMWLL